MEARSVLHGESRKRRPGECFRFEGVADAISRDRGVTVTPPRGWESKIRRQRNTPLQSRRVSTRATYRHLIPMIMRTQRRFVVFSHPFVLKGIDRLLPPGSYEVVTDEELIEGLSFPVYRRVSTSMIVPAQSHHASAVEMQTINPRDLEAAQERDAATAHLAAVKALPPSH
jgi:hypothetical protein